MSFLQQITPVVLTWNEAPNIARTLARLAWAREVVVVDSGSDDATAALVAAAPNARLVTHPFAGPAAQWRFALEETGIATPWVLRLDADYLLDEALIGEMAALSPAPEVAAYRVAFDYAIGGRRLRGSLYPANSVLFRRGAARPWQDGHTERWEIAGGRVERLRGRILHDDRKPTAHWLASQVRYLARERDKLSAPGARLDRRDRLRRRLWIAPWAVFLWCLFGKGLILQGRAGLAYAYQRLTAETMLALYLLETGREASASDPAPLSPPRDGRRP